MGTLLQRVTSLLIYGGTLRLRPYEAACLTAWSLSLPDAAQDIFKRQIVLLDRYKRLRKGRNLLLFPTGWPNGQPLPAHVRFTLQEDESRAARLRMEFPLRPALHIDAIVVLQHGQLTAIEFSQVPPRSCWSNAVIKDVSALRSVLTLPEEEARRGEMPPSLEWLAAAYPESICAPPRTQKEIKAFLSSFETMFPSDYEAMLRMTNAVCAGPVRIYGLGDVWTVPRPDGPFVSIANVNEVGELAVRIGDMSNMVYLLDWESDDVRQLRGNFSDALRETLRIQA